jgi:hypothetical protein
VARRPSHSASRKSEPPPVAADGGSSRWVTRRPLSRRNFLLLQFDAPLSCGANQYFFTRVVARATRSYQRVQHRISFATRGHVGRLY